jgi:outer membrane cobalamin receptor
VNEKAWGLVPLEATGSIKWKLMKDLQVKADLYLSDGNPYSKNSGVTIPMKTGSYADLNLGAEFSVLPKLNIWLQMNNLLNSGYQRWNQYPVMGTQVLAGVVYSFR